MECPELYLKGNGMQRRDAKDISSTFIEKMIWKPNEIVLDIGCGPGDVTSDILYPLLKNKIIHLIGVDKSRSMIEFAKKTYGSSEMDFKVLDIENTNDCTFHSASFNKIFSFFCFHWIHNKLDALINMHLMLKHGGEILVHFLLLNPVVELYKYMDEEWQIYINSLQSISQNVYSQEEMKIVFIQAGFKIVHVESNLHKYTFPNFSTLMNAIKAVDDMYNILPPNLQDKYFTHVKDIISKRQVADVCPNTGETTISYLPFTVHAVKD